jgi:hypothetical protein
VVTIGVKAPQVPLFSFHSVGVTLQELPCLLVFALGVFSQNYSHELLGRGICLCYTIFVIQLVPCCQALWGWGTQELNDRHIPTLECQDLVGHQVPGLVDVAEELVIVGLWVKRRHLSPIPKASIGCLLDFPCPQILASVATQEDSQFSAHC